MVDMFLKFSRPELHAFWQLKWNRRHSSPSVMQDLVPVSVDVQYQSDDQAIQSTTCVRYLITFPIRNVS